MLILANYPTGNDHFSAARNCSQSTRSENKISRSNYGFCPCQLECKGWLVRANSRGTISFEANEQRPVRVFSRWSAYLSPSLTQAGGITL